MAEVTWPAALPQKMLHSGFFQERETNVVRQQMEVGPDKVRKRSTTRYRKTEGEIVMTKAQLATFLTFFEVTLQEGTRLFNWLDPIYETTEEFRFVEAPSWTSYGLNFKIRLSLEMRVTGLTRPLAASETVSDFIEESAEVLEGPDFTLRIVYKTDDIALGLTESSSLVQNTP